MRTCRPQSVRNADVRWLTGTVLCARLYAVLRGTGTCAMRMHMSSDLLAAAELVYAGGGTCWQRLRAALLLLQ